MKNHLAQNSNYLYWLKLLIVITLVLGIIFRFVNIDRKIYWHDETATSLRIVGYTKEEFVKQVFNGQLISVKELQEKYQQLNSERSWADTVKALTTRPEHSPLYYLMARFWAQCFGSSVAIMRSLPVLISLLVFPGMYWLCMELFESSLIAWMAVALVAVSPVHILYAIEARQYSLWTVTVLLSSVALLRAIRLETRRSWAIYAATISLGLYSHLFFCLVAVGHGIYIFITESFQLSKNAIAYLLSSLVALITFAPWLWVMITYFMYSSNPERITEGVNIAIPLLTLIDKWLRNINRGFHDADLNFASIILVILVIYSIYFVCRYTPKPAWLFILTLIGVTALTLGLPDLLLGGQRSVRTRYFIPCYLGIQLSLAYLLVTKTTTYSKWQQKFWQVVMLLLISSGVISGVISSQSQLAWSKNISVTRHFPQIAQIINQAQSPLVISDGSPTSMLSLSYLLKPDVKLQLVKKPNLPNIVNGFKEMFLFDTSENLIQRLQQEKHYKINLISGRKKAQLWKVAN